MADVAVPSLALVQLALAMKTSKLATYYPDDGPLARGRYPKHLEFFRATGLRDGAGRYCYDQVAMLGANRVGKTVVGSYFVAVTVTGLYPGWWEGRRWDRPTKWWVCGDTAKTVRDILQVQLLGTLGGTESGMLPRHLIYHLTAKVGTPDAVETVYIKHLSGGISEIQFRSYDQRREAFQGTSQDGIWDDEEPPKEIYDEQLMRLVTTDGLMLLTMTPLLGLTELVSSYWGDTAPTVSWAAGVQGAGGG